MKRLLILLSLVFAMNAQAINLKIGQPLPPVNFSDAGELVIVNDEVSSKAWSSKNLVGKVRILQHIAGRTKVKEKNDGLMEAIKKAKFSKNHYQTTNIINSNDAIVGTGYFVKNSAKEAKRDNAHSQVILDNKGVVQQAWGLKPQESLIVLLDKKGNVQYFFEGKLSQDQIKTVIDSARNLQSL